MRGLAACSDRVGIAVRHGVRQGRVGRGVRRARGDRRGGEARAAAWQGVQAAVRRGCDRVRRRRGQHRVRHDENLSQGGSGVGDGRVMTNRKMAAVVVPHDTVFGVVGVAWCLRDARAGVQVGFIEVQIEQGPVLGGPGRGAGVVDAIAGQKWA